MRQREKRFLFNLGNGENSRDAVGASRQHPFAIRTDSGIVNAAGVEPGSRQTRTLPQHRGDANAVHFLLLRAALFQPQRLREPW